MEQNKKTLKKSLAVFLLLIIVGCSVCPLLGSKMAIAASKAQLEYTSMDIPMGKNGYVIYVNNMVKKATYSYVSSNKKIVTVDKKGSLTGIKAGKAKVTVYQTYKKKKIKVGTCTVTVKKANVVSYLKEEPLYVPIGKEYYAGYQLNLNDFSCIDYPNNQATYTYYSSNKSIVKVTKTGLVEAYKTGVVDITIKETYKKKTRTVGSFQMEVKEPELEGKDQTVEYVLNNTYAMNLGIYYAPYYLYIPDSSVDSKNLPIEYIYDEETGNWSGYVKAIKEGTVKINVYGSTTPIDEKADYSKYYVGSFTVKVVKKPATGMELYNLEGGTLSDKLTLLSGEYDGCIGLLEPDETSDVITATSSDPSVVQIYALDDDMLAFGYPISYIVFMAIKPGKATITITTGTIKKEVEITVDTVTIKKGETKTLSCIIPATGNNSNVSVSASNPNLVKINGVCSEFMDDNTIEYEVDYTALAVGLTTITVSSNGVVQEYSVRVVE
ncbi:Ig-like domain-containing protein [Anaerosporobacter faecicola]|uniref:Ig-like domain-containing protein n=1 Tax=Anaerosporobacter faecicola TaxID=2718714 RepID=UPI0014392729|nr:Ig-like domain-containing protein [Anaerosporobacter faecicola]